MTSTRRQFLGAVLAVLAGLGLGKAVPKAPATGDLPFEGKSDLGPVNGVIDFQLSINGSNRDALYSYGVGDGGSCVGRIVESETGLIEIFYPGLSIQSYPIANGVDEKAFEPFKLPAEWIREGIGQIVREGK